MIGGFVCSWMFVALGVREACYKFVPNCPGVSNYEKGILQTIGFKEFKAFLSLDEESKESEEGKKLLAEGIDLLKIATRQYAKRQIRWIQNRMLRNIRREVPPIYGLDATDVTKWKEYVYDKAENLVDCFLSGVKPSMEPLPVVDDRVPIDKSYFCDVCNRILVGQFQWNEHIKGKKHSFTLKKKLSEKAKEEKEESGKEASVTSKCRCQ
ncbi:hypothetical protein RUM43_001794 [Polyplax serrata]|uniref:C2H2-type domain-containing protein n=1 Tax=Polyplax serrata TaxID=468196 RepID=A0AAN8SIK3_POLSC